MRELHEYLTKFTDETVPCDPTLQGWADWLAKLPDPDEWSGRDEPVQDGEVFAAFDMHVLGVVRAEWVDGRWRCSPVPAGANWFPMANGFGGWDADMSWTIESGPALEAPGLEEQLGDPGWGGGPGDAAFMTSPLTLVAIQQNAGEYRVRFERAPEGPRLVRINDPVGHG